ncbi:hypothetical protein StoSoilB3_43450 (plasmid) [Arthrobacter sp. StoSoilB3]|nr:hypothetical protein StoSoilB3_43450 [Arthrobacter sp. StoSoilB3]
MITVVMGVDQVPDQAIIGMPFDFLPEMPGSPFCEQRVDHSDLAVTADKPSVTEAPTAVRLNRREDSSRDFLCVGG